MVEWPSAVVPDRPTTGDLPAGTVTFLFTDIAGSTRLLRENRHAYAAALGEHRRLLRAAFGAHGGHEVDTQGDAFFVAFPTAGQAVAAAAQAQQALAAHHWPDRMRPPVRMGLHSGEASVVAGGYVGLAVHRAARIAAVAAGGQVLLSGVTAALVGEDLPEGTALRSLGEHRLKDFPRPVALVQLDIAGLPTEFGPLSAPAASRSLPVAAGELLGRDDDVAALAALLTDPGTRLVTVSGPGGVGKTRLALEAARMVAGDFSGGAVFVALSAVSDPRLVPGTVVDAIGARREPGLEPIEALRAALGDDRTLLVLDNFEHVVTAAAELAALLGAVPAVVALVTSRTVLRLRGERHYPLPPLAEAPAVRLFAERAAAARPGFTLDETNETTISGICRLLDGLPLAIELAAARVRLLPPAALLARLSERLDVLGVGPVDLPERQRTLRATMDWSFELLDPHARTILARLAVFSGGWTLDAAEAVCGRPGEPDVLDALSALLDANLVLQADESAPEPRMDMLQTVRAYAGERLAASADEQQETEERHARYALALTDSFLRVDAAGFGPALQRLDAERANLRAAARVLITAGDVDEAALFARNVVTYLARRDAEREVSDWLDRVLPLAADAPAAVRGRLLIVRANVAAARDDLPSVRAPLEEGRPLVPDDADHAYDHALAALAGIFAALADGSVEEASRCTEDAAARFAALGQQLGMSITAMIRPNLALLRGDLEGGERGYQTALVLAARLRDEALVGQVLALRGLVMLTRGDVPGGRRSILDGAGTIRRSRVPSSMVHGLEGLAAVALADGRADVAARALGAADAARRDVATVVASALRPLVDHVAARTRAQLGDRDYRMASAEGGLWPLATAVDRTLEALQEPSLSGSPHPGPSGGIGSGG